MSFSDATHQFTYTFGEVDFGNGDSTFAILGPKGREGIVREVHVSSTETFTATTLQGKVQIGTAGKLTDYCNYSLGTLAAGAGGSGSAAGAIVKNKQLPADTQALVTCKAPTGGTPAGKGYVSITINWV